MSDREAASASDPLSSEAVWQKVGKIAVSYPLLECDKCAIALAQWLQARSIESTILRLRTRRKTEIFITSQRHGVEESITENGTHYGVEVQGKVFDNLGSDGLLRDDWVKDFDCISGRFLIEEISLADLLKLGI
jgi:hypothetical protein